MKSEVASRSQHNDANHSDMDLIGMLLVSSGAAVVLSRAEFFQDSGVLHKASSFSPRKPNHSHKIILNKRQPSVNSFLSSLIAEGEVESSKSYTLLETKADILRGSAIVQLLHSHYSMQQIKLDHNMSLAS